MPPRRNRPRFFRALRAPDEAVPSASERVWAEPEPVPAEPAPEVRESPADACGRSASIAIDVVTTQSLRSMSCVYRTHLPLPINDARKKHPPPATSQRKAGMKLTILLHESRAYNTHRDMRGEVREMICTMSDETAVAATDPFARAEASASTLRERTGRRQLRCRRRTWLGLAGRRRRDRGGRTRGVARGSRRVSVSRA